MHQDTTAEAALRALHDAAELGLAAARELEDVFLIYLFEMAYLAITEGAGSAETAREGDN